MENKFIQGTPEWLEMRRSMIMASDAPVIMGVSKWKTPTGLYFDKTEGTESPDTPQMKRGRDLEDTARQLFEKSKRTVFSPQVVISPSHSWLGASLDGMDCDGRIVEIKCAGKADHEEAIKGNVPTHYFPQLQHQMMVTGASEIYYFSYNPNHEIIYVTLIILRDEAYISNHLFPKCQAFYKCLRDHTPPPMSEAEKMRAHIPEKEEMGLDNDDFVIAEHDLYEVRKKLKDLGERECELRDMLLAMCGGKPKKGTYFTYSPVVRKGRIDYGAIPQLKSVDLELYRGYPITTWVIKEA